jgi:hypothetical protein
LLAVLGGFGYGEGQRGGNAGTSAYWANNPPLFSASINPAPGVFTPGGTYTVTVTDINGAFTLYRDPNLNYL